MAMLALLHHKFRQSFRLFSVRFLTSRCRKIFETWHAGRIWLVFEAHPVFGWVGRVRTDLTENFWPETWGSVYRLLPFFRIYSMGWKADPPSEIVSFVSIAQLMTCWSSAFCLLILVLTVGGDERYCWERLSASVPTSPCLYVKKWCHWPVMIEWDIKHD